MEETKNDTPTTLISEPPKISIPVGMHGDDMRTDKNTIKVGDYVLLSVKRNTKYVFAQVRPKSTVRFDRRDYSLAPLVGHYYNTLWEASRSSGELTLRKSDITIEDITGVGLQGNEAYTDNRNLVGDSTNQKLTQDKILDMKQQGVGGGVIIKALIQNSVSFQTKTDFSKIKYLKKKAEKYLLIVKVNRPTAANIAKAQLIRGPSTLCLVRPDTLAQILTYSNVQPYSHALIVEDCRGLITGAVAERLGGLGKVLSFHKDTTQPCSSLKLFNFRGNEMNTIHFVPFSSLRSDNPEPPTIQATKGMKLLSKLVDSLIIVTRAEPAPIIETFFPYLKPGCTFVIYNPYLEPLTQTCYAMQNEVISGQLSETWTRPFQILQARTRPDMHMHGASGFLYTGIKVIADKPKTMDK